MAYNIDTLLQMEANWMSSDFVFFWGHTDRGEGLTKACLSQWFDCEFEVEGVLYHTAEQYMMAQKALLFGDHATHARIMAADEPKVIKALGREIVGFEQAMWDENKYRIVMNGNVAKFSQNEHLKAFLMETGEAVLAEASPYDGIWGICLTMDDPQAKEPERWQGENLLGFALMEVRDMIRGA